MNIDDYKMDYEARKEYVMEKIVDVLQNDSELFVDMCDELDCWNGFLGDAKCIDMYEIDNYFDKPSDLLDKMDNFDSNDDYFYFVNDYVSTASDKYDVYIDEHGEDEVADELVENYNHIDIDIYYDTLDKLVEIVWRGDLGIDEDWEYDEEYEDDIPEETDKEFMKRIDDIY